jgi:hypothetical protein
MKKSHGKKLILMVLFLVCTAGTVYGAGEDISTRIRTEHPPEEKPYEFPQWAKDFRRADIIAFGVFPFAWFISALAIDVQRMAEHNWDKSYYTGLFTQLLNPDSSSVHAWSGDEYRNSFAISGILCASVAITDFMIIKIKRSNAEKKVRARQAAEPDIRHTPLRGVPLSEIDSIPPLIQPEGN